MSETFLLFRTKQKSLRFSHKKGFLLGHTIYFENDMDLIGAKSPKNSNDAAKNPAQKFCKETTLTLKNTAEQKCQSLKKNPTKLYQICVSSCKYQYL